MTNMTFDHVLAYITDNTDRLEDTDPKSLKRLASWVCDTWGLTDRLAEDLEELEQKHREEFMGTFESRGAFAEYIASELEIIPPTDFLVIDWESTYDRLCAYSYCAVDVARYEVDFYIR